MLLGRRQNHSERPIFLKVLALEGTPAKKIIALNQWANKLVGLGNGESAISVLQDGACASCEDSGGPLYLLLLGMLGLLVGHPAENTNRPAAYPGFALLFLCRTVATHPLFLSFFAGVIGIIMMHVSLWEGRRWLG